MTDDTVIELAQIARETHREQDEAAQAADISDVEAWECAQRMKRDASWAEAVMRYYNEEDE